MGVGEGVAVAGSIEAVAQALAATGAMTSSWFGAAIASPHQPVLFVIAEVLHFAATREALSTDGGLGVGKYVLADVPSYAH